MARSSFDRYAYKEAMLPETTDTTELLRAPERRRRLVALCGAISGDRGVAEDLAQETLLEAWRNSRKVHDPSGLDRWLAAIARNVCRRWARGRVRDAAGLALAEHDHCGHDALAELERAELVELLDRALAELPGETRDVLVQRYVQDAPRTEIASRLGVSVDAVSMRLTRGKALLRRLLAAELSEAPHGWSETRAWCVDCGRRTLLMRREATLALRCPSCQPGEDDRSVDLSLENPVYARLVGELVQPAAIIRRIGEWSAGYFQPGSGHVSCTRCGGRSRLRVHRRGDVRSGDAHALGLVAACPACGEQAWSSAAAVALAQPEVHAFRRTHRRLRALPARRVDAGVPALVIGYEDVLGSATAEVVLARDTLRVLSVHAA
jgi:RNA polymerase sigma-70 factor (ECF subfamily)